jgi:hypothetical protein
MTRRIAASVLLLGLAACRPEETSSQAVAERFIDQYYVQINLPAAEPFCTGLALEKLAVQQRLTAGQTIDDSTRKPLVRYKLLEARDTGSDRITYLFEGSVSAPGTDTFNPKWLITTRRDGDAWKVSNFAEIP